MNDHINTTTQKKFRDDFDIKINLCEPNDFDYYIDLYESHYGTKEKLKWLLDTMSILGGDNGWADYYEQMKEKISQSIQQTEAFYKFSV
jgi:hypothetical protein